MDTRTWTYIYYSENTFIKFGIKDRCLFVREYVDNAYVRFVWSRISEQK